jgi:thiol-disulfide isomerase/thioredoxin
MQGLEVAVRLVLILVFAVAGVTKLLDREGSRQALLGFGVAPTVAGVLGTLLPVAELATALLLLAARTAWQGAAAALVLLLLFMAGIGYNLARGRRPSCRCFGQLQATPVGATTLTRNAALALGAALLLWQGSSVPSLFGWFDALSSGERVAVIAGALGAVLVLIQTALLYQVLRQQGRMQLRLEAMGERLGGSGQVVRSAPAVGPAPGSTAPGFRLPDLRGTEVALTDLLEPGKPLLLLFTHPHCGPCQALMPELLGWQRDYASRLSIALISEGSGEDNREKSAAFESLVMLLQRQREVADAYQAGGTPAAVVIQPDGRIGSSLAQGAVAIRALVARQLSQRFPASSGAAPAPKPGDPAPALTLNDVDGRAVRLNELTGRDTLLLFWNPSCGYCQQMLTDLQGWASAPPPGAPELVVVSSGSAQEARAMRLPARVLLDPNHQAGPAIGAHGTPMAVLLDKSARVASDVAAGAQAVFALARTQAANTG